MRLKPGWKGLVGEASLPESDYGRGGRGTTADEAGSELYESHGGAG